MCSRMLIEANGIRGPVKRSMVTRGVLVFTPGEAQLKGLKIVETVGPWECPVEPGRVEHRRNDQATTA